MVPIVANTVWISNEIQIANANHDTIFINARVKV
jgi:hypothetical protein